MTSVFQAIAAFFSWLTGRSTAANTAAMQQNKSAHAEQAAKDEDNRAIGKAAAGDPRSLEEIRRAAAD